MKTIKLRSVANVLLAIATVSVVGCAKSNKTTINGAGASFPAPVYQNWTHSYSQTTTGVQVNYQSLGSGAGINQIKAGTIDFAGSDNPLTLEEQNEFGLVQFPMLTGGVVVIVNIPGVENNQLKLSRENLANIFLGKIVNWNDPKLASDNPNLPDLPITVVRRADASGTSFIFTNFLSKISPEWEKNVGFGSSVKWPVGIGGQKNPGVCNSVAKISGSIGYTEYTYAVEAKLTMVQLENKAGNYVVPTIDNFIAGAAAADWANTPGYYMVLTDQSGENSYPILGVTYILYRKDLAADRKADLIKYFDWCFNTGAAAAKRLQYVPLPENVVELLKKEVLK
ncbi:MAG: phosphate ABC transporter substrate-binding protein PstS [Kiritimatiellae bacterium]|nr:phosphate ABC transporter substrate-binding protein PstS [Kiritimatiellia bacterium]